jgi:hypothetical protein
MYAAFFPKLTLQLSDCKQTFVGKPQDLSPLFVLRMLLQHSHLSCSIAFKAPPSCADRRIDPDERCVQALEVLCSYDLGTIGVRFAKAVLLVESVARRSQQAADKVARVVRLTVSLAWVSRSRQGCRRGLGIAGERI